MRVCWSSFALVTVLTGCNQLLGITNPTTGDATGDNDGRPDDGKMDAIDAPPPCTTANAFGAPASFPVGGTGVALAVGDLSLGAEQDVAIAITTSTVILQNDNLNLGAFGNPITINTAATSLIVDNLDRLDLRRDLALVTSTEVNIVRQDTVQGTFLAPISLDTGTTFANASTIAAGVIELIDNDLLLHDDTGNILYTDNNAPGSYSKGATTGNAGDQLVAFVDIDRNANGKVDALLVDAAGNVKLALANNSSVLQAPTIVATGATGRGVAVGNFDGDNFADLIVATSAGGVVYLQNAASPGTFTEQPGVFSGITGDVLMVADVNMDGLDDVVTPTAVVMQCPTTRVLAQVEPLDAAQPAVVADVNNNGKPDLLRLVGTDLVVRLQ